MGPGLAGYANRTLARRQRASKDIFKGSDDISSEPFNFIMIVRHSFDYCSSLF